ncbi:transcriptional regulator [Acidisphaera rubrifaciens HS-AP3]|uniref:Transcriptional regulator n=1 Tax=Acidisphaera rubrifaciens HS-AP3 TaxID=1231350 RepID=A0A0D6P7Q0_9PROT|nr:transcriptional regulator [Acidisphaera rubrifaciens HS-AP3]
MRDSLAFLLQQAGYAVRAYAAGAALLDAAPDGDGCIVSDYRMPEMDGLALQAALSARGVRLPVIMMTAHGEVPVAVRAMKAGAIDFLEKPVDERTLLDAVDRALSASRLAVAARARSSDAAGRLARLTPREREVLDLLVAGRTNKEIGRVLGASPRTIDVHRARVFHKMEAETLPDLVRLVQDGRA